MERNELLERIKGCLIGCAYGDAMGMPSEMMKPELIKELFPDGISKLEPSTSRDFIGRRFKAGEVTDDTVNTILLCESIIQNQGDFDVYIYIDALLKWVEENGDKNPYIIGPNTAKALKAIKEGADIKETGKFATTNGSAMKVSPIGIIYNYQNENELIDKVESLCMPTHNTSIAISAAAAIAACVSYAIRGGKDTSVLWTLAMDFSEKAKRRGNQLPSASIKERMLYLEKDLQTLGEKELIEKMQKFYGTGMEAIETVPAVMTLIWLTDGDPIKTARLSANLGGDTDTIGAIAVAICSAMYPIKDQTIINTLERVNNVDFDEIALKLLPYVRIQ